MFSFMFAVLGSIVFWCVYAVATLFVGTFIFKRMAPDSFRSILTGSKQSYWNGWHEYVLIAAVNYLCWPVIAIAWLIKTVLCLVFCKLFGPVLQRMIRFADANSPDIRVSFKEED